MERPLVRQWLEREGIEYYVPSVAGKPIVASLALVRCSLRKLLLMKEFFYGYLMVYRCAEGREPDPIPDSEVQNFRMVLDVLGEKVIPLPKVDQGFLTGDKVKVINGPLEGAVGVVKRVKGDRRLIVQLAGLLAVATEFVNPKDLEKVIEEQ